MSKGMGLFHVYVEAPEKSPEAIAKLATTIGKKYGVPVQELEKRLAAGRFRVKANVDRTTADAYAKALADSGARVKIEDAVPTQPVPTVKPATPSSGTPVAVAKEGSGSVPVDLDVPGTGPLARAPMQRIQRPGNTSAPDIVTPLDRSVAQSRTGSSSLPPPTTPRPATSSLPPPTTPRPNASSLPPASKPAAPVLPAAARSGATSLPPATNPVKSGPVVASGLAAAFSESAGPADLGALSTDSLSLASLDGKDTGSNTAIAPVDLSPAITPSPEVAAVKAKPVKPKDEPVDLFAPPDAEDAALKVELAADEVEHRARKMSTPPAGVPVATAPGAAAVASPPLGQVKKKLTPPVGAPITVAADAQETPRWRFAAGVFVAILLGFLPAHIYASSREGVFAKIDQTILDTQANADTQDSYDALDAFRAAQLSHKESEKKSIARISLLIWALAGAGIGYAWFRRVPWDKILKKPA